MIDELNTSDRIVTSSPVIGIVRCGRLIDIDTTKLATLPFTPVLSLKGKLQFLRGYQTA